MAATVKRMKACEYGGRGREDKDEDLARTCVAKEEDVAHLNTATEDLRHCDKGQHRSKMAVHRAVRHFVLSVLPCARLSKNLTQKVRVMCSSHDPNKCFAEREAFTFKITAKGPQYKSKVGVAHGNKDTVLRACCVACQRRSTLQFQTLSQNLQGSFADNSPFFNHLLVEARRPHVCQVRHHSCLEALALLQASRVQPDAHLCCRTKAPGGTTT